MNEAAIDDVFSTVKHFKFSSVSLYVFFSHTQLGSNKKGMTMEGPNLKIQKQKACWTFFLHFVTPGEKKTRSTIQEIQLKIQGRLRVFTDLPVVI